jgi:hypothetical protein
MSDNTWPDKPGVPLNPDMREKLEYALAMHFSSNRMPHMSGDPRNRLSSLQRRNMEDAVTSILEVIGPCLTPAEVEARVKEARRDALGEAARHFKEAAAGTPLGHENRQRGASTYNWLIYCASIISALGEKE